MHFRHILHDLSLSHRVLGPFGEQLQRSCQPLRLLKDMHVSNAWCPAFGLALLRFSTWSEGMSPLVKPGGYRDHIARVEFLSHLRPIAISSSNLGHVPSCQRHPRSKGIGLLRLTSGLAVYHEALVVEADGLLARERHARASAN